MRTMALLVILVVTTGLCAAGEVEPAKVLDTLYAAHPRLMLHDDALAKLKAAYQNDETLRKYAEQVKKQADEAVTKPALEHKLKGPRLLSVSRDCLNRVYLLALAWRWTGDERYARAAESNLLTVAAFPDWNPSHFLDTAEMSHAVGVGYDWLFGYLSAESKATIKDALIEKGLKPGIAVYNKGGWWTVSEFNWNQVCNGGLVAGALAIAETDPDYAKFIVPRALASFPKALASYNPDGAWMEGPGYWNYATSYTAYGLGAMDTALGTDFGLSETPGLRVTGAFPNATTGPTGLLLNYADSGERAARKPMAAMFWLAGKYKDTTISDAEHKVLEGSTASVYHLLWYVPPSGGAAQPRPLDQWFRSAVDIVVMRSAWDDPNALFVGVKAGYNAVNHGHLDLGNFEIDALGVRWARDLGSDDYDLPGYFDRKKGGARWKYYRMRSVSHSVPLLDEQDQDAEGVAKVMEFESKPDAVHVKIDLASAYAPYASKAVREVALPKGRRAVSISDEFVLSQPCKVQWAMTTDAQVEIKDKRSAVLTLDGRRMMARIVAPRNAVFSVVSAEQAVPEKKNQDVRRLLATVDEGKASVKITVLLEPDWDTKK